MNLEDLRSAQVDERGTDSLQALRPTFYEEAAAYLAELRERRNDLAARLDDPFDSEEVRQLNDELETAEEVVEALYERRVGKLVKRASLAAAGMAVDEEGLTEEEQALFGDLVERIEANRSEVLDALDADPGVLEDSPDADDQTAGPAEPVDGPDSLEVDGADAEVGTVDAPEQPVSEAATDPEPEPDGGASTAVEAPPESDQTDRLTVRITDPVGEIYGVDDRVYTLEAEDVVTLPAPNAQPLLDRGAAQRLD
ncbi:MAG: hypothetical protein ABEH59_07625 [Halobacteriales archaeon]